MAKQETKDKFPSPANVQVTKQGEPKPHAKKEAPEEKHVAGKKVKTLEVHYEGDNLVMFPNGTHHLQKGANHIPVDLWEEHKNHPHFEAHLKSGKIHFGNKAKAEKAEEKADEADQKGGE